MIDQAKRGDVIALGTLLERHRERLKMSVKGLIGPSLRSKIDASDIVQETFLRAHRQFSNFRGRDEPSLRAWLRKILAHCLTDQIRHHGRRGRGFARQESLEANLHCPAAPLRELVVADGPSLSEEAVRRERALLLAEAVDRLPPDQRTVYLLRAVEHLPFEAIAPRMERSVGAARMLWVRAIERLSLMLEEGR